MLLYGNPKVRKSWLSMDMGFCIATGTPFLGFRTEQARVLIVQFEINEANYAWRMRTVARNYSVLENQMFIASPGLMYIDGDAVFNRFLTDVTAIHPQVIILDCLAACFGGDENDGEAMARFVEKMSILMRDCTASLVLVHHTNKNILSGSAVDKARGHSRLAGWVDTLCYMHEQPSNHGAVGVQLQIKARQSSRDLPNINTSFEDYRWNLV
jgi:RecA-family ATPase